MSGLERAKRRLGAWGFEGKAFPPPEPMLERLRRILGEGKPVPRFDAGVFTVGRPAAIPDLGMELTLDPLDRLRHARGQGLPDLLRLRSGLPLELPAGIARPTDDDQVETLLARAAAAGLRVIPWGGGTSVTGGVNVLADERPVVVLDLEYLSGLEELDEASGLATFGAGTRGPAVEAALGERGFTLGHFPQSFELSTLGGWIVTHSSGQESLGYGRIADLVAGADLVAPAGRLSIPALPASAAGPDLRHWVCGSEGRFGVLTRATVRVRERPAEMRVEAALCRSWEQGVEAVRRLVRSGIPLSLLRLSDEPETEVALDVGLAKSRFGGLSRAYLHLRGVSRGCLLLVGAKGTADQVDRSLERVRSASGRLGMVWLGAGPGRNWRRDRFRHPYLRDGLLDHGYLTDTFETAAPWSRVGKVYRRVRETFTELPVLCHLSHPYLDGVSLYFTFFFASSGDAEADIATWAGWKRKAQGALVSARSATSHHHGVGSWHAPWAPAEWGETGGRLLGNVARELDPEGVLNPHVLLDPEDRLEL